MRRWIALVVAIAVLGGAGLAVGASQQISLTASGPQPVTVTVNWGDTVVFANGDGSDHTVAIPRLDLTSPTIPPGGSYSQVFDGRQGTYTFRQQGTKNFTGSVIVEVNGTLTLAPATATIEWGKTLALKGTSSYGASPIAIATRPSGEAGNWVDVTTVTPAADGSFAIAVKPKAGGRFRATAAAGQLTSSPISVTLTPRIRPKVSAKRARTSTRVRVEALVVPAGAATSADLERFDSERKAWQRVLTANVKASGKVVFRWRVAAGRSQLRVLVRRSAVRPGFGDATSKTVIVTGV